MLDRENELQFQSIVKTAINMKESFALIPDVDDTLVDTIGARVQVLNRTGSRYYKIQSHNLPTLKKVIENGGIELTYPQVFGDDSREVIELLRAKASTYSRAKPLAFNIADKLQAALSTDTKVVGYITARLSTPEVLKATQQQLYKSLELPEEPIILRPKNTPIEKASQWKVDYLERLADAVPNKMVIIIDDDTSLADIIKQRNKHRIPDASPIIDIIFEGLLTVPKINNHILIAESNKGIYISNWDSMAETMDTIRRQWLPPK
jgi:hypothetical protein